MKMYNPPHPGEVLKEYLEGITVTEAARRLGVTRANLSRILNGKQGISAEMSLRLSKSLGTSPESWVNMQTKYDLWQAEQTSKVNFDEIQSMYVLA